jgi:HEAT repeat protein
MRKLWERHSYLTVRAVALGMSVFSCGFALIPTGHGQDDYIGRLLADLKDPKVEVRIHAIREFGDYNNVKDPRVVEPLIAALTDTDGQVRCDAASALGIVTTTSIVEPLIVTLKDSDEHVRSCAANALGRIRNLGNGSV